MIEIGIGCHAMQIDYYARALETLTGKRVKEKVIYSSGMGKCWRANKGMVLMFVEKGMI